MTLKTRLSIGIVVACIGSAGVVFGAGMIHPMSWSYSSAENGVSDWEVDAIYFPSDFGKYLKPGFPLHGGSIRICVKKHNGDLGAVVLRYDSDLNRDGFLSDDEVNIFGGKATRDPRGNEKGFIYDTPEGIAIAALDLDLKGVITGGRLEVLDMQYNTVLEFTVP